MKNHLRNSSGARVLFAALALAAAQLAYAHASPTHQVPSVGATVPASQNLVAIDFDDHLESAFSSIAVSDAHGKSVVSGKAVVDPTNPKHMSVMLKPLTPGVYKVAWAVVAVDGHRTQGHYTFTVK